MELWGAVWRAVGEAKTRSRRAWLSSPSSAHHVSALVWSMAALRCGSSCRTYSASGECWQLAIDLTFPRSVDPHMQLRGTDWVVNGLQLAEKSSVPLVSWVSNVDDVDDWQAGSEGSAHGKFRFSLRCGW